MNKMTIFTTILSSAMAIASTHAMAQGNDGLGGGYVGAKYGALSINSDSFDDDANAYQLSLGGTVIESDFGASLNIEAGFHQFDEFGSINRIDAKGYSFAGVGVLPITSTVSLFAKAGNLWWDANYSIVGLEGETSQSDYFYGAGAQFDVIEGLGLTLSYDRYKIDLTNEVGFADVDYESDLNMLSLGLAYSF